MNSSIGPIRTSSSENRKSTKPIMEKRRRARINQSLCELKNLILDNMKKDNARHSKLEKADILELAVKHLQGLHHQQAIQKRQTELAMMNRFVDGYSQCAREVHDYLATQNVVPVSAQKDILEHLNCSLSSLKSRTENRFVAQMQQQRQILATQQQNFLQQQQPQRTIVARPSLSLVIPSSEQTSVPTPVITSIPSPTRVLGLSGILSPAVSDCSTQETHFFNSETSSRDQAVWRPW